MTFFELSENDEKRGISGHFQRKNLYNGSFFSIKIENFHYHGTTVQRCFVASRGRQEQERTRKRTTNGWEQV